MKVRFAAEANQHPRLVDLYVLPGGETLVLSMEGDNGKVHAMDIVKHRYYAYWRDFQAFLNWLPKYTKIYNGNKFTLVEEK